MTLADVIKKVLGKPFKEGGTTDAGYDCIGLCWKIAKEMGKDIPDEWAGYKVGDETYARLEGSELLRELLGFFAAVGEPVPTDFIVAGDWILCKSTLVPETYFPAVYGGNGNFIASYRGTTGVRVYSLRGVGVEVVRAVRLRDGH